MVAELVLDERIFIMIVEDECVHAEVQFVRVRRNEAGVGDGPEFVNGDTRLLCLRFQCDVGFA